MSPSGNDCGINHNTARGWLTVLEASYIAFTIPAWHRNLGKRLVKAPRFRFYDSGLAAWLAGVDSPGLLALSPMRGPLFESRVVSEVMKHRFNHLKDAACHYFRDSNGNEVDLVLEFGGLHRFARAAGSVSLAITYGGDRCFEREGVAVHGWRDLPKLLATAT